MAPGPVRSSYEILYSCLTVLFTCSYTVFPMNIPGPDDTWKNRTLRKVKWMIITVLVPEVVLFLAWSQSRNAREFRKNLGAALEGRIQKDQADRSSEHQRTWINEHSASKTASYKPPRLLYCHFVSMGGLVIDVSDIHNTLRRITLSTRGVIALATCGHFLEVCDERIHDLDHFDYLGNGIAILQALWLILQCIGRGASGLPIALLELNTCVNVGFAVCLRLMWWPKPFGIQSPVIVDYTAFKHLIASMLMFSDYPGILISAEGVGDCRVPECFELCTYMTAKSQKLVNSQSCPTTLDPLLGSSSPRLTTREDVQALVSAQYEPKIITHLPFEVGSRPYKRVTVPNHVKAVCRLNTGQAFAFGIGLEAPHHKCMSFELSSKTIERWRLMATAQCLLCDRFGQKLLNFGDNIPTVNRWQQSKGIDFYPFISRCTNVQTMWEYDNGESLHVSAITGYGGLQFFSGIFLMFHGGIHLSAWTFAFPTPIEQLLWRLSCFLLCGGIVALHWVAKAWKFSWELLKWRWLWLQNEGIYMMVEGTIGGLIVLTAFLSMMSSFYLLLESFIALRHEPVGVFARLEWTALLPAIA